MKKKKPSETTSLYHEMLCPASGFGRKGVQLRLCCGGGIFWYRLEDAFEEKNEKVKITEKTYVALIDTRPFGSPKDSHSHKANEFTGRFPLGWRLESGRPFSETEDRTNLDPLWSNPAH
jgi:hypothetical protein